MGWQSGKKIELVVRAFGAYELGARNKFIHKNKFLTVWRRNTNKGYKLMILLRGILTLCAMNIGRMTFKHIRPHLDDGILHSTSKDSGCWIYWQIQRWEGLLTLDEWICWYNSCCQMHRRRKIDKWGGDHIHTFVFCIINLFWNRLFLRSVNTNIWIWSPPTYRSFDAYGQLPHWQDFFL